MITFFIIIALALLYNTCQIWKSSQKWDNLYKPIRSNDLQIADREILPSANTLLSHQLCMKHGRTQNEAGDYCPQCLVHISRKVTGWTWLAVWLETEMPNQTKLVFNVLTFFVFICLHFLHNSRVCFKVWVIWKQSQCHQVYDLAKIDFHYECISFLVNNLHTFCHWKVVFSLILILYRAFSHFMYLTFCQFCKRKMVQSWFQKLFWNQDCDVVGNLVVEIEIFNFCLFVCLLVCLYLTFCQFRKRKMVQS